MRSLLTSGFLVGACVSLAGCNRSPSNAPPPSPVMQHDPQLRENAGSAMQPLVGATQPGAAGAVEAALEGFRTGHLDVAFDFLPPSYQKDVNRVVHEFAERVDPELWSMTVQLLDRVNTVLRLKKNILLPLFPPRGEGQPSSLPMAWDDFTSAADLMIHGKLDDLNELKQADVRELLRTDVGRAVRRLMILSSLANPGRPDPLAELGQVQIDLVEATGSTARVRITPPGQTDVEPTDFVKVDGKWIPRSLAEGWEDGIRNARQWIRLWSRDFNAAEANRVRDTLTVWEHVLDEMLAAQSAEQMATAATPLFLQAAEMTKQIPTPMPTIPEGPAEGVSLLIARELSDDELTRLLHILEPLTDDPAREYHLATANGGKTFVSIKPVHDVAAFAAKLTFAKDPVTDEEARTITLGDVELK